MEKYLTTEMTETCRKAKSVSSEKTMPGTLLGVLIKNDRRYFYYQDGDDLYYESEFDRTMRQREKNRKKKRWF